MLRPSITCDIRRGKASALSSYLKAPEEFKCRIATTAPNQVTWRSLAEYIKSMLCGLKPHDLTCTHLTLNAPATYQASSHIMPEIPDAAEFKLRVYDENGDQSCGMDEKPRSEDKRMDPKPSNQASHSMDSALVLCCRARCGIRATGSLKPAWAITSHVRTYTPGPADLNTRSSRSTCQTSL